MLNLLSKFLSRFKKNESIPNLVKNYFREQSKGLTILSATFGIYLISVFSKMFYRTSEGVYIGHPNAWSDWALHISITQIFATKPPSEWFLYHPYFAHGKLTYGFLSHLLTGLLVKLGISIETAFLIISISLTVIFLSGLYFLYSQLFKKTNEILLAIFIFFTSSGLGIFRYISELQISNIINPKRDYTRFTEFQWLAGNIPAAMLVPQRAFFIGVSIGVWVLGILLFVLKTKKINQRQKKKLLFIAGLLAGILPIAHMHSFIVIVIVTGIILLLKLRYLQLTRTKKIKTFVNLFSWFVIPATILSNLLFFTFVYGGIEVEPFMQIAVGWTNSEGIIGWIFMWLKLWGVFLPLAVLAGYKLLKKRRHSIQSYFFLGFVIVFILGNLIQFQPTAWDNTKLFAWVYLGISIFISHYLLQFYKEKSFKKYFVFLLIILLSASGIVELIRLQNFVDTTSLLNSTKEIEVAKELQTKTETDAVFLTALEHNHPVSVWAARPLFLGYLGWIRNFGFDYIPREHAARKIYAGGPEADSLIIKYKISYVYLGEREKRFYRNVNINYFSRFPYIYADSSTIVYDMRSLWQQ